MPSDDDIALVDRRRLRWDQTNPDTLLGEGSFGVVHRGRFNGTPVAIKVVKRPPSAKNTSENLPEEDKQREHAAMKQHRREIHRFKVVQNPYIIQYLGVFRGEHPRDLYIVTELLEGGSLHDSLSKMRARRAILDDRSFLQIATHIARGLNHVHASQYTHGDMKPQNILLTSAFQFEDDENGNVLAAIPASAKVKIADFGLSKRLEGAEPAGLFGSTTATTDFGTGPCGTYLYMSPEVYNGVSQLSDKDAKAADVYAFGLVLFELLSGLQSWGLERVKNPMHLSRLVQSGQRPAWGQREEFIDPAYVDLVSRCWSQTPEDRPTVDDIVVVLEEQQELFDRKAAAGKSPSLQPFSPVTRHGCSSPECEDLQAREHRIPDQAMRLLPNHGSPQHLTDVGNPYAKEQDLETKQPGKMPDAQEESEQLDAPSSNEQRFDEVVDRNDERRNTEIIAEDDAHTVEEGEDIFSSNESGPPPIQPVISMILTDSQVAMCLPKHTQDVDCSSCRDSEHESCSDSENEEGDGSEEEGDEEEGAVLNAVSDLYDPNGLGAPNPQENVNDRFIDSIVGPGLWPTRPVNSVKLTAPDVKPLALPQGIASRPVLGMGSVAAGTGLPEKGLRSDSAVLHSFIRGALATTDPEKDDTAKEQASATSKAQDGDKVAGDPESIFEPEHRYDLGPAQAPQLPEAPTGHGNENGSAPVSHPQTPEETDAARAAALQRKANNYSSPNVEEGELNSLWELMDGSVKSAALFPPPDNSHPSEPWSSSQGLAQNGLAMPAHGAHVVPASAPMAREKAKFSTATVAPNVDYVNSSVQPGQSHLPNPYGSLTSQGASAPPLSDTSQSALGVPATQGHGYIPKKAPSPAWTPPGSNYRPPDPISRIPGVNLMSNSSSLCPQSLDSNAVIAALQRHDATSVLGAWWLRGHTRTVSAGLAQASAIGGEELLELVRDFTAQNNQQSLERRDPIVAKDLCAAIGHIARNASHPLGPSAIIHTVPAVLSVLPAFQQIVHQRHEVYSFANFALCNLFKVYNVIPALELRRTVASWIAYSISWNVAPESNGPRDEVLAYTATSAARNFMWMNEKNVEAFVDCTRHESYNSPPPKMRMITSMQYFDWQGRLSVVEASLSAMAMIIHFPRQRAEFMKVIGAEAVIDVLHKHADNSEIISLAFWMITVLFSGPPNSHTREEAEILRRGFIDQRGCQRFVTALERVSQRAPNEKQKVESLEKGYNALLTVARFGGPLRAHLIDAGCMPMILNAVRQLASSSAAQCSNAEDGLVKARGRLGVVLCELIREVSNEHKGMSYMRDNNVRYPLQDMLQFHRADDGFTNCCRVALTKLAY